MKKDEREKLLNEVLGRSRSYNNIYNDSLDIVNKTQQQLDELSKFNQEESTKLSSDLSDEQFNSLQQEIAKDFGLKVAQKADIKTGEEALACFGEIIERLKAEVIGQEQAAEGLALAFKRPYITGHDSRKLRNTIYLSGEEGTGRHELLEALCPLLKEYGLFNNGELYHLDLSRYQTSAQEALFLQDLYTALYGEAEVVVLENYEEASPIYLRMLSELSLKGSCALNKSYTLVNGQLQEASARLSSTAIDSFVGNDKTFVLISTKNINKLPDFFGKSFVDNIADSIVTQKLSDEVIQELLTTACAKLCERCKAQLKLDLKIDQSAKNYILAKYDLGQGRDSLTALTELLYNHLVDIVLKNNGIKELLLADEDGLKAVNDRQAFVIALSDDNSAERAAIAEELDEIVGLQSVKDYLLSLENHLKVSELRKKKGLKTAEISKHMIFTGNPGTGKTTIARIVARMMKACGILKQGQLVEVTRADLVGKYVGHTAPLTLDVINSALGGVLFIDEAYSLYRGKDDSFGLEAIDMLVKAMEDHRDDLIVILAGYSKEMAQFLEANSGLKSRFANIIEFPDYTGEELMKIAVSIAKSKDYRIADEALEPLKIYFEGIQALKDPNSGNGRLARNLVEAAILKQSKRLLEQSADELDLLILADFTLKQD